MSRGTPVAPDAGLLARADSLRQRGCHRCLKEALAAYEVALARGADVRDKAVRTALLLGLREKELGIPGRRYLEKVSDLLSESFASSEYAHYVEIAQSVRARTGSVSGDVFEFSRERARIVRLEAASHVNAAVGFVNTGRKEEARAHALEASSHPDFQKAAAQLLESLGRPR